MPVARGKHAKQAVLRQHATLNPRPGRVTHALFEASEFFDPNDLLQVKYEMLRLVTTGARSAKPRRPAACRVRRSTRPRRRSNKAAWPV